MVATRTNLHRDGLLVALGVIVLLLGTTTGSATAMLAMAVVALALIAAMFLRGAWRSTLIVITVAAATATMFAFTVAKL